MFLGSEDKYLISVKFIYNNNISFNPEAKTKNLSLLFLSLILKKFKNSIILLVESDGWICVSVNSIMSLFIVLSCFESDLTF